MNHCTLTTDGYTFSDAETRLRSGSATELAGKAAGSTEEGAVNDEDTDETGTA